MNYVIYPSTEPFRNEWGDIELYRLIPVGRKWGIYELMDMRHNPFEKVLPRPKRLESPLITLYTNAKGVELFTNKQIIKL